MRVKIQDVGWWMTRAVLIGVVLSGCAGSGAVRGLAEESRLSQARLGELVRANNQLREELKALATRLEGMQGELEGARREAEGRQRGTLEALEDLRARLSAAETQMAETETRIAAVETRVTAAESRFAGAETRVQSLAGTLKAVETTIGGLADHVTRLETLSGSSPATTPEVKAPKSAPRAPVASLTAEELFNRAMASFRNGELGQAILDFEDFLARHRSHAMAGSAQFWIAEAYFTARDYQHAAVEYRKALDLAPKGDKTPDALFKLGLAYRSLKRPDRAREAWAQLLRDFPQSDAAQKAQSALRDASHPSKP